MFNIQLDIVKRLDPDLVKKKAVPGLEAIGKDWVRMVGDAAPVPPVGGTRGISKRTGIMEQRAGYKVHDAEMFVELGTVYYGRWVLITGSGLFGPRGAMIRPKNSAAMVFPITNRMHPEFESGGGEGSNIVFAKATVGQAPWPNFAKWKPTLPDTFKRAIGGGP